MHVLAATALFAAVAAPIVLAAAAEPAAQDKKGQKAQPKFDPPKIQKPDGAALKAIAAKTDELRKAVAALRGKIGDETLVEVEIYLKAAENIVRFEEWFAADSGKWALMTLDQGLERARRAEGGKAVWRDAPGKWVVRAYRSWVDGSIQPYAALLPHDYGTDPKKKWRLDVVLHGRDSSLTEAKFIATHGAAAPKDLDHIRLEVYGRGNNAYRWAGETDVFEARDDFARTAAGAVDGDRVVLRGFSMGGAGTWHIGLHHPGEFCVIGPGAGFTTTRGYVGNLPKELPAYVEKCLHIYDAVDYAENAFAVPVVAYSGEKDAQKAAADNIENALKGFQEPFRFTHLVAPGLGHQMPKEWQDKAEIEYRKFADKPRPRPERIRFVTYTPRYGTCEWATVRSLDATYTKAVLDATHADKTFVVKTSNVRRFDLGQHPRAAEATEVTVDGTKLRCIKTAEETAFEKRDGVWAAVRLGSVAPSTFTPDKRGGLQGPIDDAFGSAFRVVKPTKEGFAPGTDKFAAAAVTRFAGIWDRYFRGSLPLAAADKEPLPFSRPNLDPLDESQGAVRPPPGRPTGRTNLILFGDPLSNPLLGMISDKLPITWTPSDLVVNGVKYDVRTHVPVLIYPNPLNRSSYVVINSGHTFTEADLKGTNALLYPRLGDWAVIKPRPTDTDPAAYDVVAAGLFDENWQFPRKK